MSANTTIEWTDITWNPIRGCTKISPGCAHCYAETFAERFRGVPGHPYEQGFDLRLVPEKLTEPFRWSKPSMVFVNSMSDLFHRDVPEDYIEQVVRVMALTPWHTYQVLTKRSERLQQMLESRLAFVSSHPHIWWGVSVEDRRHGLPRIEHLRASMAPFRMLSMEPLLEDLGSINLHGIGWVIAGGESGHGARPLNPIWVRSLRDQCKALKIPFFFKQWGGVQKGRNGRILDGRAWDEVPIRTNKPIPALTVRKERMRTLQELINREFLPLRRGGAL